MKSFNITNSKIIFKVILSSAVIWLFTQLFTIYHYFNTDSFRLDNIQAENLKLASLQSKIDNLKFKVAESDLLKFAKIIQYADENDKKISSSKELIDAPLPCNFKLYALKKDFYWQKVNQHNKIYKSIDNKLLELVSYNITLTSYNKYNGIFVYSPKDKRMLLTSLNFCAQKSSVGSSFFNPQNIEQIIKKNNLSLSKSNAQNHTLVWGVPIRHGKENSWDIPLIQKVNSVRFGQVYIGVYLPYTFINNSFQHQQPNSFVVIANKVNNQILPFNKLPIDTKKFYSIMSKDNKHNETTKNHIFQNDGYLVSESYYNKSPWKLILIEYIGSDLKINIKQILTYLPSLLIGLLFLSIILYVILYKNFTLPLINLVQLIKQKKETSQDNNLIKDNLILREFNQTYNELVQQIKNHNINLEKKIKVRTRELEKAKAIAELSNIRINQEINILNHELRTPLSSLMAASELISYKENSHKKFLIKTIKQSSSILQDHLNNLIENRKIEAGNFSIKLKQTNIKQLIEDCGLIFYTNPDNRKRKFSVFISNDGMPESIMTDPVKIRQILINLISNAIKFSQQGPILINLSRHENNLYISITDQGIGIKKSSQKHIFEAYSRENDKIAGTGLGLAISSKTANLLKGQITVKSEYGKGSTFTLKIPIILPKFNKDVIGKKSVNAPYYLWKQLNEWGFKTHINNSSSQNLSDPIYLFTPFSLYLDALNLSHHKKTFIQKNNLRHHYRLKILLVDDFEINLEIFSLMLKSLGHDVQRANTGYKALQMGSENIYDVVFMDIRMKDLDGVQTTQKWKENQNILDNNTPIVALTADTLDIKKYQEKNIFFQIASKPIDRTMFEKIIKDVIDFQKKRGIELFINQDLNQSIINNSHLTDMAKKELIKLINDIAPLIQNRNEAGLKENIHLIKGLSGQLGYLKLYNYIHSFEQAFIETQNYKLIDLDILKSFIFHE